MNDVCHCDGREGAGYVLVAEDAPEFRRYLQWTFKKLGAKVDVAADGLEAVELLTRAREAGQPHDLILSDLDMPAMNGYEFVAHVRGLGVTTPVVALTGNEDGDCRDQCLHAGFDEVAVKPVAVDELRRLWQQLLSHGMRQC